MKKAVYNKAGTKQIVDSGWKLFDKQTNCICKGNAFCNTQYSSFIRPWNETECNGKKYAEGQLMHFDLRPFCNHNIPQSVKEILTDKNRTERVYLYMFFVYEEYTKPFLWVVTTTDHKLITSKISCGYKEIYSKRFTAEKEILSYITE